MIPQLNQIESLLKLLDFAINVKINDVLDLIITFLFESLGIHALGQNCISRIIINHN